jgi:small subunit ribosomal protein S20
MANSAQTKKRARQNDKQRAHNASLRTQLRTAVKKVQKAVVAGDQSAAMKQMQESQSVIDRIADKRIVHKNLASRVKSNLVRAIKAMGAAVAAPAAKTAKAATAA